MGGGALFEAPAANLLSMLAIELGKGTATMTACGLLLRLAFCLVTF